MARFDSLATARAHMEAKLRLRAAKARKDPNDFIEFTGRVEGGRWIEKQDPVHREWQDFLTEEERAVLCVQIGSGKSTQVQRWRVLYEIGRNPNIRVGIFSESRNLPEKMLSAMKADIEYNPRVKFTFPGLKRATGVQAEWSQSRIIVDRTDIVPDPTVQICGLFGNILGSRLDLIILDDILDMENTLTDYQREKVWDWVSSEVFSRLPPGGGGRVWFLGHVWHPEDALSRAARLPMYKIRKQGARVQYLDGEKVTSADPEFQDDKPWEPLIGGLWTKETLQGRYDELEWKADFMLDNRYPAKSKGRFNSAQFARAITRGRGYNFLDRWNPADAPVFTGVDLGMSDDGSLTVLLTAAVLPGDGTRRILDIRSGHWDGPEIIEQLSDVHRRYGSIIAVENNSAQKFLLEFAASLDTLPVRPHQTGINKHDLQFGVESLGLELSQDPCKWIFPAPQDPTAKYHHDINALIEGALSYTPEARKTSDHLMAWWICREAIRQSGTSDLLFVPEADMESMPR